MAPRKKPPAAPAHPAQPTPSAAPVAMTPELFEVVLARVADGAMVNEMCAAAGMPCASSFYAFVRETAGARARLDEAIAARGEWRAGKIHELAAKVEAGKLDPQSARVAFDAHRFLASKEAPRRYGDHLKAELTGANGKDLIPDAPVGSMELARWIAYTLLTARDEAARKAAEAAAQESTEATSDRT